VDIAGLFGSWAQSLMKDICNFKKGQGAKAKDNTWSLQWAGTVVMLGNKISNFRRRAIEVHAPTRWASNFKVVKSVRRTREALQQPVWTEQWNTAFKGEAETTASLMSNAVQNTYKMSLKAAEPLYFWEKVNLFLELIIPVADAIHQVEADLPLMSQAWPMLQQLQNNFQTFSAMHSDEDGITDHDVFCWRHLIAAGQRVGGLHVRPW
jgi:hypothetical protein